MSKKSIVYNSESADNDESIKNCISSRENNWLNGCRYALIIDKLKPNSKSKIKEHTLSSNNLDKELNYAHLLYTMQKPPNKDKHTRSNKKLKHVHFSPIIFVKLVIPAGKKNRQSNTWLIKALVDSGASYYILAKSKSDKLPVKKTKQ